MRRCIAVLAVSAVLALSGCSGGGEQGPSEWRLASPDGALVVTVAARDLGEMEGYPDDEALYYRIEREGTTVVEWSPLGLSTEAQGFHTDLRFVEERRTEVDESYTMRVGKRAERAVRGAELALTFENRDGAAFTVVLRAHEDGAAFRYRILGEGTATLSEEHTGFAFEPGGVAWMQPYDVGGLFQGSYEAEYGEVAVGDRAPGTGWSYPALFEVGAETFVLLTESGLEDSYAATRLAPEAPGGVYRVRMPTRGEGLPSNPTHPTADLPWTTPWRVLIVGSARDVVESTLVDDLAPPSRVADAAWVRPGRVAWSWPTQLVGDPALQQQYVAFAAEMGWEHVLVDANWDDWPDPPADVQGLVEQGAADGVDIHLWYNSGGEHNTTGESPRDRMDDPEARRAEMARIAEWGVAGIKVDFFESDKQARIEQFLGILEDAAEHELMVNFHGCTLPRGWQRTYPHLMTHEAVRGTEYYMALPAPTAADDVKDVFLRNVVGSMDYTPLLFEPAVERAGIPYAHELALAVAFESGLTHFSDNADMDDGTGYRRLFADFPFVESFLMDVPTTWDETRLLSGDPRTHAVLARRKGESWYVAALSGQDEARELSVPLSFLEEGRSYRVTLIVQGETPRELLERSESVVATDRLEEPLEPRGGLVAVFRPE